MSTCVGSIDSWKDKRVQKTGQVLGVFNKLGKTIAMQDCSPKQRAKLEAAAAKVQAAISRAVDKDKSLSNLKGKSKELANIVKSL